jgi:hypothetical protein
MTKLLFSALLLAASTSFAVSDSTHCSNATGSIKYETVIRHSGVPPRPGEKRQWTELTIETQVFQDQKVTFSKEKPFHKPTEVNKNIIEDYTTTLTAAPWADAPSVKDYMICKRSKYVGPPLPMPPGRGGNTGGL